MAHFIDCPSCGKQFNKDVYDKCPFCGTSLNKETSDTVICPNKICQKEVSVQFESCPFCGTFLSGEKKGLNISCESQASEYHVTCSGWHTYATIMLIFGILLFIAMTIASFAIGDWLLFSIGLGEFIMFSLFCGIVQLLAGIKHRIDNLHIKQ